MKKILFSVLLMILPVVAWADDSGVCGENVTYAYEEATHTLTISGSGNMTDYYWGNMAPWYNYRDDIVKLIIEDGVTSIGDIAFYGCTGLTSVTIPNSVTSIKDRAFEDCSGLTSVTIPNSVTSIFKAAFFGCSGLTSITIPDNVSFIDNGAFGNCSSLTSVTIPNSVRSIRGNAFSGCSGLTSVTVLCSPTYNEFRIFENCPNIKEVTFDCEQITSLFKDVPSIEKVTITDKVVSISDDAFSGCEGLPL